MKSQSQSDSLDYLWICNGHRLALSTRRVRAFLARVSRWAGFVFGSVAADPPCGRALLFPLLSPSLLPLILIFDI